MSHAIVVTNTSTTTIESGVNDSGVSSGVSSGAVIGLSFVCMLATIVGACLPIMLNYFMSKKVDLSKSLLTAGSFGFAGGAILFGSLFDILPSSVEYLKGLGIYTNLVAMSSMLLGIVVFIVLEKIVLLMDSSISCPCHVKKNECDCDDFKSCGCVESVSKRRLRVFH